MESKSGWGSPSLQHPVNLPFKQNEVNLLKRNDWDMMDLIGTSRWQHKPLSLDDVNIHTAIPVTDYDD